MTITDRINAMLDSGDFIQNGSVQRLRRAFEGHEFERVARLGLDIRRVMVEQPGRDVKLPALSPTEASILADLIAYGSARVISDAVNGLGDLLSEEG